MLLGSYRDSSLSRCLLLLLCDPSGKKLFRNIGKITRRTHVISQAGSFLLCLLLKQDREFAPLWIFVLAELPAIGCNSQRGRWRLLYRRWIVCAWRLRRGWRVL